MKSKHTTRVSKAVAMFASVAVWSVRSADPPNGLRPDGWGDSYTVDQSTCGHGNQAGTCLRTIYRYQKCKQGNPWDSCTAGYVATQQSGSCRPIDVRVGFRLGVSGFCEAQANASCAFGGYKCYWN